MVIAIMRRVRQRSTHNERVLFAQDTSNFSLVGAPPIKEKL